MKSAKTADPWKRLFSLFANIMELVVADKRYAEDVADVLQVIKNDRNFAITLGRTTLSALAKDQLADWTEFYREEFGITLDIRSLEGRIPAHKAGFDRLIVVPRGMTFVKILDQMKRKMSFRNNWSDAGSFKSVRKADWDYAVWIRDRHEADEELVNRSASTLGVEKINCITLEERLLLELFCFWTMGVHLDVQGFTLCAGSHDRGCLPKVACVEGDVVIDWVMSSDNCSTHRGRQVVS